MFAVLAVGAHNNMSYDLAAHQEPLLQRQLSSFQDLRDNE